MTSRHAVPVRTERMCWFYEPALEYYRVLMPSSVEKYHPGKYVNIGTAAIKDVAESLQRHREYLKDHPDGPDMPSWSTKGAEHHRKQHGGVSTRLGVRP